MQGDLAKMVEGKLPELPAGYTENWWTGNRADFVRPYVALDGKGEAYVLSLSELAWLGTTVPNGSTDETSLGAMYIRAPAGNDVAGRLFVPKRDLSGMVEIKFKIAAAESKDKYGHYFFQAKGCITIGWSTTACPAGLGSGTKCVKLAKPLAKSSVI